MFSCDVKAGMLGYNYKAPTTGEENNLWKNFSAYKHCHFKILMCDVCIVHQFTYANNLLQGRLVSKIQLLTLLHKQTKFGKENLQV